MWEHLHKVLAPLIHRGLAPALPGIALVLLALLLAIPQVFADSADMAPTLQENDAGSPILLPGTVAVDPALQAAVLNTLRLHAADNAQVDSEYYAITDVTAYGDFSFVSVLGLHSTGPGLQWNLTQNGDWFGLFLMTNHGGQAWTGAVKGTEAFSKLLAQIPTDVLDRQARNALDDNNRLNSQAAAYRFPWPDGTAMLYGVNGVHEGGFNQGWAAVDFMSDGNTSAGHAPNKLLAAAPGTVGFKCTPAAGERSTAVQIDDLLYLHLLNSPDIFTGKYYQAGDQIGAMLPGSFNEKCGYAAQQPDTFHVHWGFPNTGSFQAGGWTLSISDQKWRRGVEVKDIGSWLRAEVSTAPTATPSPSPSATFSPTPTATSPSSPTATQSPVPSATSAVDCRDLLLNGGFEEQSGWVFPVTAFPAGYNTSKVYDGLRSARSGITDPDRNIAAYSSLHQFVDIPAEATNIRLRLRYWPQTTEPADQSLPADPLGMAGRNALSSGDAQMILILDETGQELDRLLLARQNETQWLAFESDLSHRAGQTIKLYFGTYNNGEYGVTSLYVDDVSLTACSSAPPVDAPTATPATATASPTTSPGNAPGDNLFYIPLIS
jgi:hypothetical protein